jgi:hypothetical protein
VKRPQLLPPAVLVRMMTMRMTLLRKSTTATGMLMMQTIYTERQVL